MNEIISVNVRILSVYESQRNYWLKELLHRCAITGHFALREELEQCSLTGGLVLPNQLETCSISGQRIIRGRMSVCEVTKVWLAPSVAAYSDFSKRAVHPDLIRRSERPPHLAGLPDEMGVCEISGRQLLPDELGRSVVTNRLIDRDLLVGSGSELAHPSEMVRCEATGQLLLPNKTGVCDVSKRRVGLKYLVRSELSGRMVLDEYALRCFVTTKLVVRDELEMCSITEQMVQMVLPSELGTCAVSNVRTLKSKMVRCVETSTWLAPWVAAYSDVSKRAVRPDLIRRSERSPHRAGLPDEMGVCKFSGRLLLLEEMARSVVTDSLFDRELLVDTGSGLAHPRELVRCEATGRLLLPNKTGVCDVTKRRFGLDYLVRSELSGRIVHINEALRCFVTNQLVVRDELEMCAVTKQMVLPSELGTCAETNLRAIRSELVHCAETNVWIVPAAAGKSDYRPRWVIKRLLKQSKKPPYRMGTIDEFGICSVSEKRMLLDELGECSVSHQLVDRDLLVTCGITERQLLKSESRGCDWLGKRVTKKRVRLCKLTGMAVARDYLDENGMLQPLAELLDGNAPTGAKNGKNFISVLEQIDPKLFAGVDFVRAVRSPGGDKFAVCATIKEKGWFTSRERYAGFVLAMGPKPHIVGDLVLGTRINGEWEHLRTVGFG